MRTISSLEYLSMSKPQRTWYKFCTALLNIPAAIAAFFCGIPGKLKNVLCKIGEWFASVIEAFRYGDWKTRLSSVAWGTGCFAYGQIGRGILLTLYEIAFVLYMVFFGGKYLAKIGTLGTVPLVKNDYGVPIGNYDNSFSILLYSMMTIVVILFTIFLLFKAVKMAYDNQLGYAIAKRAATMREDVGQMLNHKFHLTILAFPSLTLVIFTVVPLMFMILVAFTNFHQSTMPPANLFTWVGFDNFKAMLTGKATGAMAQNAAKYMHTFWYILRWTLIWAVIATVTTLFGGMFVAILINKKGIRFKKFWRTCLVTVIAVPQFISLLLVSKMFVTDSGIINYLLKYVFGLVDEPVKWLDGSRIMAQAVVILVNMWVGIPYTVLTCTGILMNIPSDLYEASKIDGANPFKTFTKITFPYMMFVLGPSMITTFTGNINNFNLIFLLTGGASGVSAQADLVSSAGDLDLLITWLYKMTVDKSDYDMASVIGILLFIVIAFFSLIAYSRVGSVKNEEEFQ